MSRHTRRWLSIVVLAMLAFFQASMVLAACAMDRAALAQVLVEAEHDCCDGPGPAQGGDAVPMSANACLAYSTSDLQASGNPLPIALAASDAIVLFVSPPARMTFVPRLADLPRAIVPSRILLHSFLI